jgi:hypothetical protein
MENLDFSVGIPSVSQNGKARNSIPNHSAKDKNAQKSVLKHSGKMKTFGISFRTILLELPFQNKNGSNISVRTLRTLFCSSSHPITSSVSPTASSAGITIIVYFFRFHRFR